MKKIFTFFAALAMLCSVAQEALAQGQYWLNVEPNYEGGGATVNIPVNYDWINGG